MALRIFYIVIALVIAVLSYDIYRIYTVHSGVDRVDDTFAIGPEDADLTVVEFLDYSCGHCQNIHPVVMAAIRRDGNIRYIPRPIPVVSDHAIASVAAVYTAAKHGKFLALHEQLITTSALTQGPLSTQILTPLVRNVGLNIEDFASIGSDITDKTIKAQIVENLRYFNAFEGKGTPMFVLNGQHVYYPTGAQPSVEELLDIFKQARMK